MLYCLHFLKSSEKYCRVTIIHVHFLGADDCDFDDDKNQFCHWRNVNGTLAFKRKYLWTGTAGTGPQGDHSKNAGESCICGIMGHFHFICFRLLSSLHWNNSNFCLIVFADGKYIYLESSSPAKYGQLAQISSRIFKPTENRTIKFYIYMHGKSVNFLRVLINATNSSREIWRMDGEHGRKWIFAKVAYSCLVPYRVSC